MLRLGYANEPPTLDPLAAGGASTATRDILRPVLPALFRLNDKLEPEPELAVGCPSGCRFTLDPFTVTVRLREASWSDGRPISASDVRFTWTKLREGPTGYRYRFLKDVRAPSERTVVLDFDRPVRRWWALFSVDDVVLPAHAYDDDWAAEGPSVSGGPFAIDGWTKGLQVSLVRNERFWGDAASLAGIDVMFVPDDETRLQLLERGDLDLVFAEGDVNIGRRAEARGFGPRRGPLDGAAAASGVFGPTWWELDLDPVRLKKAVALGIVAGTHPTLAAEIFEDSGLPLNAIRPDFTRTDRDTATPWRGRGSLGAVTGMLDRAGVEKGSRRAEFQLVYPSGTAGALAAYMHFRLEDIGLLAELVGLDSDVIESRFVETRRAPVMLRLRRGSDAPDAGSYASSSKLPGSGPADAEIAESESGDPTDLATGTLLTGLNAGAWAEAQRALAKAGSTAPLVHVRTWLIGRDGVRGPHATGAAPGPLWNAGNWTMTPAR